MKVVKESISESLNEDAKSDDMISKYEELGYKLKLQDNIATATKINSKSLYAKPLFNYRFKSNERRDQYVLDTLNQLTKYRKEKQDHKDQRKVAKQNMENPYKVGDILYNSWGYDQTNIDFYQVVEVGKKSVKLRGIAAESVSGTQGFMSENVKPIKDEFISEPETKLIQVYVDHSGKTNYYISAKFGAYSMYTQGDEGVYSSHYA